MQVLLWGLGGDSVHKQLAALLHDDDDAVGDDGGGDDDGDDDGGGDDDAYDADDDKTSSENCGIFLSGSSLRPTWPETQYLSNNLHETQYLSNNLHETHYLSNYLHETHYLSNYLPETQLSKPGICHSFKLAIETHFQIISLRYLSSSIFRSLEAWKHKIG